MCSIYWTVLLCTAYYTGCIKKTEQILNCSQRREAAQSMKFLKFKCFESRGGGYFQTNLKWLMHKIWMLKSKFKLAVRQFVRCFIAVQNFKQFGRV